jgi:3-oxoacyl-[acyl-carrier protein] reductase
LNIGIWGLDIVCNLYLGNWNLPKSWKLEFGRLDYPYDSEIMSDQTDNNSTRELAGKVAMVTGASRGLGRAIAIRLASLGARVALNYHHRAENARQVAQVIEATGAKTLTIQADVRDASSVKAMMNQVIQEWDKIDILVNNAGIVRNGLLLHMADDAWQEVLDTNLKGAYLCSKYALPSMLDQGWGRIINISSVAALRGNYGQSNYAAAKGGLISLTRSLAREVGSRGVTVNAVAPGLIATDMMQTVPENYQQEIMSRLAIPRVGQPEDVAGLVCFLAGEHAGYITAQVIGVDGGLI